MTSMALIDLDVDTLDLDLVIVLEIIIMVMVHNKHPYVVLIIFEDRMIGLLIIYGTIRT